MYINGMIEKSLYQKTLTQCVNDPKVYVCIKSNMTYRLSWPAEETNMFQALSNMN
jgi:hypothetical protein